MKKLVKEGLDQKLNENTTDHFVVDSRSGRIKPSQGNSRDYWQGSKRGEIDMEIEVFGFGNMKQDAQELYDALVAAGLEHKYFKIKIETK